MTAWRHVAAAVLALSLAGCANTNFTPTSNARYRPWGDLVQVTDKPPPVNYIRLGIITAHGGWSDSETELIEVLKASAAMQGANVIVLLGGRQPAGHNMFFLPQYDMSAMAVRTVR
jgi:hypothetical protein